MPPASNPSTVASPHITPDTTGSHSTPASAYSDFLHDGTKEHLDHFDPVSPQFAMDWSGMHMSSFPGFDPSRADMMMSPGLPFTPDGFMDSNLMDPMGYMGPQNPAFHHGMSQMQIPLPTPNTESRGFPTTVNAAMIVDPTGYFPSRDPSVSGSVSQDVDATNAAVDSWSAFRCSAHIPSSACPKSAKHNLESLEQGLKSHDSWSKWRPTWDEADYALGDKLTVAPLQEMPRDKLLAITQSFLHKALDTHKDEQSMAKPPPVTSSMSYASNFVILPPARVLEFFLQSYVNGFERFYPMTSKGSLNPNELLHLQGYNDKVSSLLLLLMIAQGAMITPSVDARWLTAGLTEACRISLFDIIEKNVMLSGDFQCLHSALLVIVQGAWSGDKWQMDKAMGQRNMYLSMLRHSSHMNPRRQSANIGRRFDVDVLWNQWVKDESSSR